MKAIGALGNFVVYTVLALVFIGILTSTSIGKFILTVAGILVALAVINLIIVTVKNTMGLFGGTNNSPESHEPYPESHPEYEPYDYMEDNHRQVYGGYNPDSDFDVEPEYNPIPKPQIRAPKRPNL